MAAGGKLIPIKYMIKEPDEVDLKMRLVFNKMVNSYNFCQPLRTLDTAKLLKRVSYSGLSKGVENQTGIILNLFDEDNSKDPKEHIFFLPTPDGLFVSEEEVQRMLSELAVGIFYYETVPFLSIHFNRDLAQYPIIHPAYVNTFTGYVISMLDYCMKGFINGFYFDESFIEKWQRDPKRDEKFLTSKRMNLQKYCQEKLNISYQTFRQIYKKLENELPNPKLINYDLCSRSFRIVAKQTSIKRAGNLFILDGDFDVFYSLESKGMDPIQQELEEKACQMMCEQIKAIMPQIPLFKKYFQALSWINFLSYHYLSLKKNDKVPDFKPKTFSKPVVGCPSIFPPYPTEDASLERLEIRWIDLVDSLGPNEKQCIFNCIRDSQNAQDKNAVQAIAKALYEFAASRLSQNDDFLTRFDWSLAAQDLIKICRNVDKKMSSGIDASLVMMGLKQKGEKITPKMLQLLITQFDAAIEQATELIKDTQSEIRENQRQDLPSIEQFAELAELNRLKQSYLNDKHMMELWAQGSLTPSMGKMVVYLDTVKCLLSVHPEKAKGMLRVAGGCGMHLADITAEPSPLGSILLEKHKEKLASLPHEMLFSVQNAPISGVFLKIAYEDFMIVTETEKIESLGYYCIPHAQCRLDNAQAYTLDAIACQDESRFKEWAGQVDHWDFQDPLGVSILHYAAYEQNPFFLNYILDQCSIDLTQVDTQGYTALHHAARYGNLESVKKLVLKAPKLIDVAARSGETALHAAAQNNHLECVRFLLKNGADLNLTTAMGVNPLMAAVFLGHQEIALELLNHATIDLENCLEGGTSVFHLAVEAELEQVVDGLCKAGCDVNRVRADGYTPLHIAAQKGWMNGICTMLNRCIYIDLNAKTAAGYTPLELAEIGGHPEVVSRLRVHTAN